MMYGSKWIESGSNATIKIDDISFEAFELIKSYVYGLDGNITVANCISLYYGVKKYMIETLSIMVEKYIFEHVNGSNILYLLHQCKKYHLPNEFVTKLTNSIEMNQETCQQILNSKEFLVSPSGKLIQLDILH